MKFRLSFEIVNKDELIREIGHLAEDGVFEAPEDARQYFLKHLILKTTINEVKGE
jgi:hypothetical protein